MIRFIHSAKEIASAVFFALFLLGLSSGCASDNIHMPDPEEDIVEVYDGTLTTSIPDMPSFASVVTEDYIRLRWNDEQQLSATLELGAFDVDVQEMAFLVHIGEMKIENVNFTPAEDGTWTVSKEHFECQAGDYLTKGRLTGRYAGGKLELTLHYKPGSMPFECQSVFEGHRDK